MNSPKIHEKYIPTGHPNRSGEELTALLGGAIHFTANFNPRSTDLANAAYFSRAWENGKYLEKDSTTGKVVIKTGSIEKGSAGKEGIGTKFRVGATQTICDMDSITYCIPYTEKAPAVGDRNIPWEAIYRGQTPLAKTVFGNRQNSLTVSWEICCNNVVKSPGKEMTKDDPDWEGACEVTRWEIARFLKSIKRFPIFDLRMPRVEVGEFLLVRHFDLTGKNCPSPFIRSNNEWKRFQTELLKLF
jgi:hypothetical protein